MTGLFVKLDVEYASDDKMIEAGPMAELLYVRGLAFCKKNSANDGRITSAQLAIVGVGIPSVKKAAQRLTDVGAWTLTDRGWIVTAWLKRNRSGADIQAQQEMASALGIQGNHERWHTGPEGKPSPKCPLCVGLHRQTRSGTPSGNPIGGSSPETETETEEEVEEEEETKPEEETETKQKSSSSANNSQPAVENPDDDDEIERRYATDPPIVMAAANLVAEQLANRNANGNRHGYIRAVLNDRPRIDAIRTIHEHDIELTAEQIAARHLGTDNEPTSEPREPWYADPHCSMCPGDGWTTSDAVGYLAECPCRRAEPYIATVTPIRGAHT